VAYLGHYTPHIPYTAKQHLIDKNSDAFEPVYAALIETLDTTIGMLTEKLDELALAENTIFVFTSDNGGLHVPEGPHVRVTHNTPYRAGKGYTYEGGQRVPLIVCWPGHVPEGRVIDTPVNNIDWIPTLLELVGTPVPQDLDGVSFAKGLLGADIPQRKLFWHFPHYTNQGGRPSGAMRDGNWLLVELYDASKAELYDLSTDVGELQDLAHQHPERVTSMRAALDGWRTENNVQYNMPNPDWDVEAFKQLYVETDPSKFDPLLADEPDWNRICQWREGMDVAHRKGQG
jgi:arylsulfatase A-like enzyme